MLPDSVSELIRLLSKWPGIGPRGASRIALHLIRKSAEESQEVSQALLDMAEKVGFCSTCGSWTEDDPCPLCTDARRDDSLLCVVADPASILNLEKGGGYHGRYHVIRGNLSPLRGAGPDEVGVPALLERVREGSFTEVILALSPTMEGEATTLYLADQLKHMGLATSRLASGLPVGGDVDSADEATLMRALDGRQTI